MVAVCVDAGGQLRGPAAPGASGFVELMRCGGVDVEMIICDMFSHWKNGQSKYHHVYFML